MDDRALEDYHEGSILSYNMRSSSFHLSTPNPSLQCIAKDHNSWHLDLESHKQSLQLCEIGLLKKQNLKVDVLCST